MKDIRFTNHREFAILRIYKTHSTSLFVVPSTLSKKIHDYPDLFLLLLYVKFQYFYYIWYKYLPIISHPYRFSFLGSLVLLFSLNPQICLICPWFVTCNMFWYMIKNNSHQHSIAKPFYFIFLIEWGRVIYPSIISLTGGEGNSDKWVVIGEGIEEKSSNGNTCLEVNKSHFLLCLQDVK